MLADCSTPAPLPPERRGYFSVTLLFLVRFPRFCSDSTKSKLRVGSSSVTFSSVSSAYFICAQVMVKEHVGNFERSRCLGEIVIKLDGLNLTTYTLGWYRLFAPYTVELGSAESLHLL